MRRTLLPTALSIPFIYACSQGSPPQTAQYPHEQREEAAASMSVQSEEDEPEASGPAPNPHEIQAAILSRTDEIRQCYVMGTFREPQLAGTVHVRFTINSTGKVSDTSDGGSNMPDPEVVDCVLGVFANLEFRAGSYYPTEVEYPITFGKS